MGKGVDLGIGDKLKIIEYEGKGILENLMYVSSFLRV